MCTYENPQSENFNPKAKNQNQNSKNTDSHPKPKSGNPTIKTQHPTPALTTEFPFQPPKQQKIRGRTTLEDSTTPDNADAMTKMTGGHRVLIKRKGKTTAPKTKCE